jgi:alpha-galactosidase
MTKRRKVVLIGAGSTVFTQRLVADIILSGEEDAWEIALVDIDPVTLEAVDRLVAKMLAAKEARIPVIATTDRREVLPGADFVVTTIAVGGRPGWQKDIEIPRKHGIWQPVGDTMLPGGISRAMRMVPPMVEIARDVERLCPQAYLFNYSNPMTALCRAIRRETSVPVVGLCHGVLHVESQIARFLGAAPGSVTSLGVGLNHLTFLTQLFLNGQDARPLIRERLAEQRRTLDQEIADKADWPNTVPEDRTPRYADDPFSWGIYEAHSVFPCAMDRHAVEFFPELFPGGSYHGRRLGREAFPIDKRIALGDQWYEEMLALARSPGPLPQDRWDNLPGESEQLLDIMHSLMGDGRKVFSVNVPNRGQASYLPRDAIIECNAAATGGGFVPLLADDLPEPLAEKLRQKIHAVELTVEAAVTGDREVMLEAMLADGGVTDVAAARALRDDLLNAHRAHLPQFA